MTHCNEIEVDEIYVSVDVETDGPIPGPHSMLSLGAAAFSAQTGSEDPIDTFTVNLETLPGATMHPKNEAWWYGHPEAWAACRSKLVPPVEAMTLFHQWLRALSGAPVFMAYPVSWDFMFVYWYLMHFVGESRFEHRGLDIKSYAMAALRTSFTRSGKHHWPEGLVSEDDLAHTALEDAIDQGKMFMRLRSYNLKKPVV